ncbi:alpha-1,3/1,6-mannosyltransferase ALG2 [Drosophila obscura]|uniref:alpha-1,3/1,6-mannosyltransferase ALG2 n=1 Tax=Drosophila obscura TaxID=7282 RepID=UPI001BB1B349|nr:alpha-1,3/1,6-mannosyltransferase ALG2 [Drosophila obscura]XP_022218171.2 alpha-1,3/1,6-mannosyltransferase ALG2 [Drosophila obscura]
MVRILFLHPDLGIGGAERLVVDAALALKERGHELSFLTNHHDSTHCFKETADGSFPVQVVGDWLPRKLFGRFYAFCAYIRMLYAAFYASFFMPQREKVDVVFCDLISVCVPVLRLARHRPRVIFYCHFPDQLLSAREGLLKRVYRAPINWLEEQTVGLADKVLVNSKFTLRVFQDTFRRLRTVPDVLYPSIHTQYFDQMEQKLQQRSTLLDETVHPRVPRNAFIYLDINRYERKKNHALALKSLRLMGDTLSTADFKRCRLIIAGGYDTRCHENVEHYAELEQLTTELDLQEHVILLRSPTDEEKCRLLYAAHCLLYTPANEHFGIVPLEGMYFSKPVVALNSGGPTETVVHSSTGFLCEKQAKSFGSAMCQLFRDEPLRLKMGDQGHKRVQQKFSFAAFADRLNGIVQDLVPAQKKLE